jgi:hypothetical protein
MSGMKKRVAIIGAGPGGLVAASKLLQTGKLSVTIYEKGQQIGGLWASNSLINPEMRTNSSMFTASFSDLSWESIDIDKWPAPVYPKAWMVERYLQEYARRFILDGQEDSNQRLVLGTRVKSAARVMGKWRIVTVTSDANEEVEKVEKFDYLVLATGYLSDPKPLDCEIEDIIRFTSSVPIMHSTQYRQLNQLGLSNCNQRGMDQPWRVLVVGGSHSGSDMASLVAWQASNERWAPGKSGTAPPVEVIHITPHQLFAVPAFSRDYDNPCAFQPFEYKIFDRASRGTDPISHTFDLAYPEDSKNKRMMIKMFIDGGLEDFDINANELPPYCVISETYNHLVKNKVIKPVVGQLKRLRQGDVAEKGSITATVTLLNGEEVNLDAISAVINATGFNSRRSLTFMAEDVRNQLSFEPLNSRLPMVLDDTYLCQRSNMPDLAVLGFNSVISWGIVEMQSRAIAMKWAAEVASAPSAAEKETCKAVVDHIYAIREAMRVGRRSSVPQVAFSDYMGLMEQAGRELGLERVDLDFSETEGFVCAARWVDSPIGKVEAMKTMARLQDIQRQARDGTLFLARSVFHGLAGKWVSDNKYSDGVQYTSEVEIHPRYPTHANYHFEYVAIERFTTISTYSKQTEEKCTILRYTEHSDEISAWEVDPKIPLEALSSSPIYRLQFRRTEADDFNSCSAMVLAPNAVIPEAENFLSYRFDFKGTMLQNIHIQRDGCAMTFGKPSEKAVLEVHVSELQILKPQPVHVNDYATKPADFNNSPYRTESPFFVDAPFRTGTLLRNALSS